MLTLPRVSTRVFRALLRKCVPSRSRGPVPAVLLLAQGDVLSLVAATEDVTLRYTMPNTGGEGSFLLPMTVLEEVEGTADAVEFIPKSKGKAIARWSDCGVPKEIAIDLLPAKQAPDLPALPDVWSEATSALLVALYEAGRTAGRESGRYSTQRIQIRGAKGQILSTDCNQALIHGGFAFSFPETLYIPAVPVFAAKELAGLPVRIGRTETHLVIEVGSWTIWLAIDRLARFPEIEAAVSKAKGATTLTLSETDAAFLLDLLPQFPGHDQESAPITLDFDGQQIAVRGRGSRGDKPGEVFLTGSTASGLPIRLAFDRRFLMRALSLGFRRLRLAGNANAFVAVADDRLFLAAVLDPSLCVGPPDTIPAKALAPLPVPSETTMPKNTEPEPSNPDLLAEAEGLRVALVELAQRAGRLIALLKSRKKDERVLNQVWSSLKSLQLGGGPPR
jgi:hypothetical protein